MVLFLHISIVFFFLLFLVAWVVFFVFGFVVFSPFLVCNACGCVIFMILGLFGTFTSVGFLVSKLCTSSE
jgi:hypothetical protein